MPETEAGSQPANAKASGTAPRFVGHAVLVSVLTLVSRVTGLIRDAVLFAGFGRGPIASAFLIGFMIPNLFRRLFGEGALTAAFIPAYAELLRRDPVLARRFASLCIAALLVVTSAITLVGEAALLWMLRRAGLSDDSLLAVRLTMLMLPYMPMICLVALIGGLLQVHDRFGPAAVAPIILNLVMIAAIVLATIWMNQTRNEAYRDAAVVDAIVFVSTSVLLAGLLQLIWQVVSLFQVQGLTLRFAGTVEPFKKMLVVLGPMVLGLAVFQINAALDTLLAWGLAPKEGGPEVLTMFGRRLAYPIDDAGQVVALAGAQRLYQFPLGVFGIAIATAIFPALAHAAADRTKAGRAGFRETLQHGLRLSFFIGLPASLGLILVRVPLTRVLFEHGRFELEDSLRVAVILAGYASAVWAYSMTHILTRAFYAVGDSRTPLRVSMGMVVFNLALNLTLIWPLGAAGLAWSTAISAACQVLILLSLVRRHVDRPVDTTVLKGWLRTVLLSAVMTVAVVPLLVRYPAHQLSWLGCMSLLAGMVLLGAAVVFLGARLTGAEELRWLRRCRSG
ncbi:MAG: murein biosynthesis integral membrane protein MurJ [Phycisphaeraceae bacterium]